MNTRTLSIASLAIAAMLGGASTIASAQDPHGARNHDGARDGGAGRQDGSRGGGMARDHGGRGPVYRGYDGGRRGGYYGPGPSYGYRGYPSRHGYYPYGYYSSPGPRYYGAPYAALPYFGYDYYYEPQVTIAEEYVYPSPPAFYELSPPPMAQAAPFPPPPPAPRLRPEPTPQPARPTAPSAPRLERFTLSASELFAFDRDELRTPQPKLDEIAAALNNNPQIGRVNITGYTDRLGTTSYNLGLSQRRADAVKGYLINRGVAANRIDAVGRGEADPVVNCNDKNRAALIKCLEPNRRVEVEPITVVRNAH